MEFKEFDGNLGKANRLVSKYSASAFSHKANLSCIFSNLSNKPTRFVHTTTFKSF